MTTTTYIIDPSRSTLEWVGRKITGAHNGTIQLTAGDITVSDGRITAGHFDADTTTITVLDVADPELNAKFTGHLHAADFFGSAQHPRATFRVIGSSLTPSGTHRINGELTIKGITRPIDFDAMVQLYDGRLNATAALVVDRTKYGMRYGSGSFFQGLGDTLIHDAFTLNVSLVATPA